VAMVMVNTAARFTMGRPRSGLGARARRRTRRGRPRTSGGTRADPGRRTRGRRPRRGWPRRAAAFDPGRSDQYRRYGNVVVRSPPRGRDGRDLVHHVHPFDDLAEDGVAGPADPEIEGGVVLEVDEELRGRAVGVVGAGHGQGAPAVAQAVAR